MRISQSDPPPAEEKLLWLRTPGNPPFSSGWKHYKQDPNTSPSDVGLCERKIIERRTETISLAWFSPFSHLDEPCQGNKGGVEIYATLLIHRRQSSSAKRQHSSNAIVWQSARCTFSTLEISKVEEISKLTLFPWQLSAIDGPPLVMGEREDTLLWCEFEYSVHRLPGMQEKLLIYEKNHFNQTCSLSVSSYSLLTSVSL